MLLTGGYKEPDFQRNQWLSLLHVVVSISMEYHIMIARGIHVSCIVPLKAEEQQISSVNTDIRVR